MIIPVSKSFDTRPYLHSVKDVSTGVANITLFMTPNIHQWLRQISMKLLFLTPLFYWLKVILIVIELILANKKGGSEKVVSSTFEKTTDEYFCNGSSISTVFNP